MKYLSWWLILSTSSVATLFLSSCFQLHSMRAEVWQLIALGLMATAPKRKYKVFQCRLRIIEIQNTCILQSALQNGI